MKHWNNERGNAIAIVVMFLGVLSMVAAGLCLQSQMDVQFTSAVSGQSRLVGLADGGASIAVKHVPDTPPGTISSTDLTVDPRKDVTQGKVEEKAVGTFQYRVIFVGRAPQSEMQGFEISGGGYGSGKYYPCYWIADSNAWSADHPENIKQVQIPLVRAHRE